VTQPDRASGRGQKINATPVKYAAQELGLTVFQPDSLRTFAAAHAGDGYDLLVVASYGKILPRELLDLPALGALNVHPSLLPKYRGATPIQAALLEGETETGVTIILMDAGMDTGDVVLQEHIPIAPDETYGELHDRLARFGAKVLSQAIDLARSGHIPHVAQSGKSSVTRPLRKDDLAVQWSWPAKKIVNAVRAFAPVPAARAVLQGETVKLLAARAAQRHRLEAKSGEIVGVRGDALVVRCADGAVEVLELIPPNRRAMSGASYAR
jgi:methionyl-tRNA formyltransferase